MDKQKITSTDKDFLQGIFDTISPFVAFSPIIDINGLANAIASFVSTNTHLFEKTSKEGNQFLYEVYLDGQQPDSIDFYEEFIDKTKDLSKEQIQNLWSKVEHLSNVGPKANDYLDIPTKIEIEMPHGFMNVGITTNNMLIADTNDRSNWDTLKFPLPDGKWRVYSAKGKKVVLIKAKNK